MNSIGSNRYFYWALAGFIILSLFGVVLRYMQLFPLAEFNYMFLLHAHSHFAFAGWMFFSLALLIAGSISPTGYHSSYQKVFVATLLSAFGMLVFFSVQGYKALSIAFSTLFILVTYRFTYLILKESSRGKASGISGRLIKGSLIFLCLSSLGPFLLGPIMGTGLRNTPIYQNAIYYYLHFQMNGWMLLAGLGLLAGAYLKEESDPSRSDRTWLNMFIFSNIPLFAIFTLWTNPSAWIWIIAIVGSVLQLISWIAICLRYSRKHNKFSFLISAALIAITLKSVFQVLICVPSITEWTLSNRNLIIGYIHLITLGCVTPVILDLSTKRNVFSTGVGLKLINGFYILLVIIYLGMLFMQPLLLLFGVTIANFPMLLLIISVGFLSIGSLYMVKAK